MDNTNNWYTSDFSQQKSTFYKILLKWYVALTPFILMIFLKKIQVK